MNQNKNILKGNRHAELKVVNKHSFYAVIDVKAKDREGNMIVKSIVQTVEGTRMEAKNELYEIAKEIGGKVSYFGGFKK